MTVDRARAAVRVEGLSVEIKGAALLDGVDLAVERGEWVSVIGPNGAGKSTLLKAIAGVISSVGTIELCGMTGTELSVKARSRLVSWVPQTPTLPEGISVFDYVLLGRTPHLRPLQREGDEDLAVVERVLDDLDLTRLASRSVDTLSGGELQRAVVGRALAQESPIILLDEPTAALDLGHQQDVLELLDSIRAAGERTVISTMHDLTLAGVFADRLVMLTCGQVVASGPAGDVLTEDNLRRYYGAAVEVRHEQGNVLVTPRLTGRHATTSTRRPRGTE